MNNGYKTIIALFLLIFQLTPLSTIPFSAYANTNVISSKAVFPNEKVADIVESVKGGKKVSKSVTLFSSGDQVVNNRYTVFFKKDSQSKIGKSLSSVKTFSVGDQYGDSIAVPITTDGDDEAFLDELDRNPDVLAISQVVVREPNAVSAPNDPLYPPAGNFSSSYQWNLNRSASGEYGIDMLRAWEYLDSQGKNWMGDESIVVSVIDTGLAYETISKYPYTGGSWGFAPNVDTPSQIYVNAGETANNGIDDDGNGQIEDNFQTVGGQLYCLDANTNGQCDSPSERTKGYVDDVNGFNVVDFYSYWNPLNIGSAPLCSNAPYTSYRCVPQRVCATSGDAGSNHFGCVIGEMGHPNDMMGHGTAVSGVIAGKIGNAHAGTGIAPNVKILPINVFQFVYNANTSQWQHGQFSGSSDLIARAVEYANAAGSKIINMSFGGTLPDPYEQLAMERAYEEDNILLVAASGNRGVGTVDYPAGYPSVMAVGASSKNGTRVSYSSYGSNLELVAPVSGGIPVETYTCYFASNSYSNPCLTTNSRPNATSQFTQFSTGLTAGTSFSAPQVAGVAALVWTMYPGWSNEQVRYVLNMSSTQPNSTGYNTSIGYGILNAYNAVRGRDDAGRDLTQTGRVMQSVRGSNNLLYDRYSDDHGNTWSNWNLSNVSVISTPAIAYNSTTNLLLQARRDSKNGLFVRNSTNNGNTWSSWLRLGSTSQAVKLVTAGDRIIMAMRGTDRGIYTRYTVNGTSWSSWNKSGSTDGLVSMVYDSTSDRLIQGVRGMNGMVYTRYSSNKGNSWSAWSGTGSTPGNLTLISAGSRVILFVRGNNNLIYSRYSTNGGSSWSGWVSNSSTYSDVEVVYTGSRLIQVVRDSRSAILTRYSSNLGSSWSGWIKAGSTNQNVNLEYDSQFNRVFSTVIGMDGGIWTRYSDNGGTSWGLWTKSGTTPSAPELSFWGTQDW